MDTKQYQLTKKEALDLYVKMVLTRKTEAKHEELFQKQLLPIYTHQSLGQEAVGCGIASLLRPDDYIIGTHRGVPEVVGKGMSVTDILLEYGGRKNSPSGGRAGLHLHSTDLHILPLAGGLGTDFSMALGAGLTVRNKGLDQVVVDSFGEGAAEQVDFMPAMNMSVLWGVPVIFACCTNQFIEYHPYRETTTSEDIATRAEACGMKIKIIQDSNDIFAVGSAMKEAISLCRREQGPYFLEFKTYRLAPHHTGDQCVYRSNEEVNQAWEKDPIPLAEKKLLKRKWVSKEHFRMINEECDRRIEEAVQVLMDSPLPEVETVTEHVYVNQGD